MNVNSISGNSPVKEGFRVLAENEARSEETEIRKRLQLNISSQTYSEKLPGGAYGGAAVLCAISGAAMAGLDGFLFGAILGPLVILGVNVAIAFSNKGVDGRKDQMTKDAEEKIADVWRRAQQRYQSQCDKYDADVKGNSKKILGNAKNVSPMVDHSVAMFERMISHSDSGSNRKFIEADFTYKVRNTGITYSYESLYTNSMDDFDFSRERFHNIGSAEECEGLARALAKLIIAKMMTIYPEATTTISLSHVDAEVTLHFKGANKNFVPARDIF